MNDVRQIQKDQSTGNTNVEAWTIGDVYRNREMILAHPEQYGRIITRFSAGGLGACAYKREVSISQLVQCWQQAEFRFKCLKCGHEAYIYHFAGHVNGGGYWEICAYCPECDCGYSSRYPQGLPLDCSERNFQRNSTENRFKHFKVTLWETTSTIIE